MFEVHDAFEVTTNPEHGNGTSSAEERNLKRPKSRTFSETTKVRKIRGSKSRKIKVNDSKNQEGLVSEKKKKKKIAVNKVETVLWQTGDPSPPHVDAVHIYMPEELSKISSFIIEHEEGTECGFNNMTVRFESMLSCAPLSSSHPIYLYLPHFDNCNEVGIKKSSFPFIFIFLFFF